MPEKKDRRLRKISDALAGSDRGFFPGADAAEVVVGEKSYPMILEDEAGLENASVEIMIS